MPPVQSKDSPSHSPASRIRTSRKTLRVQGQDTVLETTGWVSELTHVLVAAVQNRLIATCLLAYSRQGVNDAEPDLLPLHGLVDSDILDMPDLSKPTKELVLDENAANTNDAV